MRRRLSIAVGAALALALLGVALFSLRGVDAPAPPSLSAGRPASPQAAPPPARGSWEVRPGGRSFVGYRVKEELAGVGLTEAVGRTRTVRGALSMEGGVARAARFSADLRKLESDEPRRDNTIRERGLESDRFPTATFLLSSPVRLLPARAGGAVVNRGTARGRLTLHGVTRDVRFRFEARRIGERIEAGGFVPIRFADYGIEPPSIAGFASVRDSGRMEFLLDLRRRPAGGEGHAAAGRERECPPTPPDALGPFYEPNAPVRTSVGEGYRLAGTVRAAGDCRRLPGARVEFWLVNEDGEYDDDHRATVPVGPDGTYRFESNRPVGYGGRPPHVHIRVAARGFRPLVTQHYPRGDQDGASLDLVLRPA